MNRPTHTWKAIEDNAGGLHLYVFEDDVCVYVAHGLEEHLGVLDQALVDLEEDHNAWRAWEQDREPPQLNWLLAEAFLDRPGAAKIIADENGVYPERMGAAGHREFPETISTDWAE